VLQAITRKVALGFRDGLPSVAGRLSPVTLNKYVHRLSAYWKWLVEREHVEANVWAGLSVKGPPARHDEREREFTEEEMLKLLGGPATQQMHDLMRIAALTGARLDAIVDLKARDVRDGLFIFKPQKKERGPRGVPIHRDLVEIIRRRTTGKAPDDDVFPEWPAPKKKGSQRERSFKASNAFTDYRREVGVDDVLPGKRRSRVNFHSFRRWFITMAERADQPESIIAVVVGHKRTGMTLGVYSGGPLMEQARRCVEAVNLPRSDEKRRAV
jgi:integrase